MVLASTILQSRTLCIHGKKEMTINKRMNMNKILKYLSIAAIMVPSVSCTEEKLEIMDPATLTESVSIVMDTENEAKI